MYQTSWSSAPTSRCATISGRLPAAGAVQCLTRVTSALKRHSLKFGLDYREMHPVYQPFEHRLYAQFRDGRFDDHGTNGGRHRHRQDRVDMASRNWSAYAQDTWRLGPRGTADLGLRWDVNPPPSTTTGTPFRTVVGVDQLATMQLAPASRRSIRRITTRSRRAPVRPSSPYSARVGAGALPRRVRRVAVDLGAGVAARASDYFPFRRQRNIPAKTCVHRSMPSREGRLPPSIRIRPSPPRRSLRSRTTRSRARISGTSRWSRRLAGCRP